MCNHQSNHQSNHVLDDEADQPLRCGACGDWVGNPLTASGVHNLIETLRDAEQLATVYRDTLAGEDTGDAWSEEWPTVAGRYWCYGYPFGTDRDGRKPELQMCEVVITGSGPVYIVKGHFCYRKSCGKLAFQPAAVPTLPKIF